MDSDGGQSPEGSFHLSVSVPHPLPVLNEVTAGGDDETLTEGGQDKETSTKGGRDEET